MGTVFSGFRGWRGGKPAVESLPEARLTYRVTFSMVQHERPRVIPESEGFAFVKYGLREWPVLIGTSPCHFGGHRRWLVCSICETKRVSLYVAGEYLACRECMGLRYGCQHESEKDRTYRRANAIRERLKWEPGIAHPNGPKPRGMHRITFNRLVTEHDSLVNLLLGNVSKWIEQAETRLQHMGR